MASDNVGESLDFDFFETPRDDGAASPLVTKPMKAPLRPKSAKPSTGWGNSTNSSSKKGQSPMSPSGSSDEYSSISDSDCGDTRGKDHDADSSSKRKSRSPSLSSLSSSGRSRSRSRSLSSSGKRRSRRSRSRSSNSDSSRSRSSRSGDSRSRSVTESKSHNSTKSDIRSGRGSNPSPPREKDSGRSLPKRGASRLGEDEYCSSAYSEEEAPIVSSSGSKKLTNRKKTSYISRQVQAKNNENKPKRQAWGEEDDRALEKQRDSDRDNSSRKIVRPGTAKVKSGKSRQAQRSDSDDDLSDSDMTDVSPIDSPRSYMSGQKKSKGRDSRVTAAGDSGGGSRMESRMKFRAMPVSNADLQAEEENDDDFPRGHKGGLDLDILMEAVGELEKQKRMQENSRRVMFAPMMHTSSKKRPDKANYTFDKTQSMDIDRENQRLLKEIVRRVHGAGGESKKQYYRQPPPQAYKLTASAVNREREMKRIENENMAFLKRLQKVKPTKTICRDNQIHQFETTQLHGVPIGALHPMPKPRPRSGRRSGMSSVMDDTSSLGSRTRSMSSIHSGFSGASTVRSRGSRPNSRPGSATKRVENRPQWSDRW